MYVNSFFTGNMKLTLVLYITETTHTCTNNWGKRETKSYYKFQISLNEPFSCETTDLTSCKVDVLNKSKLLHEILDLLRIKTFPVEIIILAKFYCFHLYIK